MRDIERLALMAASKPKKGAEPEVAPGSYSVDFKVHVKGTVQVGEDETYTPTTHVPLIPAMALALRRSGVQRDGIVSLLVATMTEVMTCDDDFRAALAADVEEAEKLFRAGLAELPKATRKGKTRAKLTVSSL